LVIEKDGSGPHLLGGELTQERGRELRELFMRRVLAPAP